MDRNIFSVSGSSPPGATPPTSRPCGPSQTQQGCLFTALPHVTDLATCMIHDIIAFSKSLTDFK